MRGYCDLHTHSYFSDGTLSPTELIDEAERIELIEYLVNAGYPING